MADVMPHVAASDLVYITEWVVGAAMFTTALGVVGQRLLARRSIGIQVALVAIVTVVTALAAVGVISYCMLAVGDREIMLELMGIAGLAGLAVALVIGMSVTRATRRLLGAVREVGDSSTVTVHVRRLREKIETDPTLPRRIVTVWGVGYRYEPGPT